MRNLFICALLFTLLISCTTSHREKEAKTNRKYVADKGYRHQVDRLEEVLNLNIFKTDIVDQQSLILFVDTMFGIIDAMEPLVPPGRELEGDVPMEPPTGGKPLDC